MNISERSGGNAAVPLLFVVSFFLVIWLAFRWVPGLPWIGPLFFSPSATIEEQRDALEEENERLKAEVETLSAELERRVEDEEREQDATRRLFWRD